MMKFLLAAFLLSASLPSCLLAENNDGEIIDFMSVKYKLVKPADYDSKKAYPLLVYLHGGCPVTELKSKPDPSGMKVPGSFSKAIRETPVFILLPRATKPWWVGGRDKSLVSELVMLINKKLSKDFKIDTTRLYIAGYSDGGTGILHALAWYPNYFAGAIPMSGWLSPGISPNKAVMSKTAVWWFAGKQDNVAPWKEIEPVVKSFQKARGNLKLTTIEVNGNHGSPERAFSMLCDGKELAGTKLMIAGPACDTRTINPAEWLLKQKL